MGSQIQFPGGGERCSHISKWFSDTRRMFKNSTQFWGYPPGDSIRFPRLRVQSYQTCPTTHTSDAGCKPRLCTSDWLAAEEGASNPLQLKMLTASPGYHLFFSMAGYKAEVPMTPSLGFAYFARMVYSTQSNTLLTRPLVHCVTKEQPDGKTHRARNVGRDAGLPSHRQAATLPAISMCSSNQKLSQPHACGFLWRLHCVVTID